MQQSKTDHELQAFLQGPGDEYAAEKEMLGMLTKHMLAEKGSVTNKDIILYLVGELESTSDHACLKSLRNCLGLVVGLTSEDA